MRAPKPVKLHELLGTATVWTDELWDSALEYLLENTATPDALSMITVIPGHDHIPDYRHKIDYLREFRQYPPTLVLAAFDYRRAENNDMLHTETR